jgi:hypothetical protein
VIEKLPKEHPLDNVDIWFQNEARFGQHNTIQPRGLIKLPAYSPELNPIEQVWQWLRQNE